MEEKQLCRGQVACQRGRGDLWSPTPSIDLVKIWVNDMHLGCRALCQSSLLFQSETPHFLRSAIPGKLSTDAPKKSQGKLRAAVKSIKMQGSKAHFISDWALTQQFATWGSGTPKNGRRIYLRDPKITNRVGTQKKLSSATQNYEFFFQTCLKSLPSFFF